VGEPFAKPVTDASIAPSADVPGPSTVGEATEAIPVDISGVVVSPKSFNPSVGQIVTIGCKLAVAAVVSISIYGPNGELIRELYDEASLAAGNHRLVWDGKDSEGDIVRDEAYFFVIEARAPATNDDDVETAEKTAPVVARYDPLEFSGGELINPQEFHFKPKDNSISYVLPKPARVRIRAGVDNGPMLNTMVNWQPRVRGLCTEVWRGKDRQGVRHFSTRPDCFLTSMAYALPENSIIAFGNREESYREWYLREGHKRPKKPDVPRSPEKPGVMCLHWYKPPHLNRDPGITVTFPELEQDPSAPNEPVRLAGDSAIIRVSIPDEADFAFMDEQKFEMVLFVEDRRILEAEQSHAPFNWRWDLTSVPPGLHYLTVNLVSATDHVGTFTALVEVAKETRASLPAPDASPTTPPED